MGPRKHIIALLLVSLCLVGGAGVAQAGVDGPHDSGSYCSNCHDSSLMNLSGLGAAIDNTTVNSVCWDCHRTQGGGGAMIQETHSARTTSSTEWSGTWTYDCTGCHDPHYQKQVRSYGKMGNYPSGPIVATGTVTSIVGNVVTASGSPGWTVDKWARYMVMPNKYKSNMYRIIGNNSNQIYLDAIIDASALYTGSTTQYVVFYGKLIRDVVKSGHTVTNSSGVTYVSTTGRYAMLFNTTGPYSILPPGDNTNPGTKAVCIVCHSKAKYQNYGFAVFNTAYEATTLVAATTHASTESSSCWENTSGCHAAPAQGFAKVGAECGKCHGLNMAEAEDPKMVIKLKNGSVWVDTWTGVGSVYNHPAHVARYGNNTCSTASCHYQAMNPKQAELDNTTSIVGDYKTLMQFYVNSPLGYTYNSGTYSGFKNTAQGGVMNNIFSYNGYSAIAPDGTTTCTNTYCHGKDLDGSHKNPTWKNGSALCGSCHRATMTNSPTTGSHLAHTNTSGPTMFTAVSCNVCHPHSGEFSGSGVHVDGEANLAFAGNSLTTGAQYVNVPTVGVGPVPRSSAAYGNCTTLNCHGGATAPQNSPKWGGTLSLACGSCHNRAGDVGGSWSGAHGTHMTDYYNSSYTCNACHTTVASSNSQIVAANKGLHVDGSKQVVINAASYGSSSSWNGTTCSSVTCHSTGNRLVEGYAYNSVTWNIQLDCAGCHKFNNTASTMLSEANGVGNMTDMHVKHVATDAPNYNYGCDECHLTTSSTGTTITNTAWHTNGLKNVVFDAKASLQSSTPAWGGANCTGVYCHSTGNRPAGGANQGVAPINTAWTNSIGSLSCAGCHKTADTEANMRSAQNGLSNSHIQHVGTGTNEYGIAGRGTYQVTCDDCHKDTTDDGTTINATGRASGHINGVNDVKFNLTNWGDTNTPVYNTGTKTCNNVYCHSYGSVKRGDVTYNATTADWDAGAIGCSGCHGFPPSNSDHTDITNNCRGCHTHVNADDATFEDITLHINYSVDGGSCTTCHNYPPIRDTDVLIGDKESGRTWASYYTNASGLHDYHYNTTMLKFTSCNYCHYGVNPPTNHNEASKTVHVGFDFNGYRAGWYQAPSFANTSYALASSNVNTTTVTNGSNQGPRVCYNIYCHSDGGTVAGQFQYKYANWDEGGVGAPTRQCNICHGIAGGAAVNTNAHPKHVSTYTFICYECHKDTVNTAGKVIGNHVNAAKNVAFANVAVQGSYAKPDCTNTYCHSTGQNKTSPTHAAVSWSITISNCISCHDDAASPATTLTAPHTKHTLTTGYNLACTKCHDTVLTSDTVIDPANRSLHVNLVNDVDAGIGFSAGNCTATTCHSTGSRASWKTGNTGFSNVSQAWNGTTACTGCHKMSDTYANMNVPATGLSASHWEHVGTGANEHGNASRGIYQIKCEDCHNDTTTDSLTISAGGMAYHVNGTNDVKINITNWGDTNTPVYNTGTKTCNNVYCHSYGSVKRGDVTYNSTTADWDATARGCNGCHGFPPATSDHSGQTTCKSCHSHSNANNPTNGFDDVTLHINYAIDGGGCTSCHQQPPLSDTYGMLKPDQDTGRIAAFTNGAGLHDYHYNTTMLKFSNCAYCHYGATGSSNHNEAQRRVHIAFDFGGQYTSGWYQAPAFSNVTYLLNSSNAGTTVATAAGARVCYNIYCHGNGGNYAGTFSYQYANWDQNGNATPTRQCNICHGTAGGAQVTTDRHPKHITTYTYACIECHAATVNSANAIIGNHVDKIKNVVFGGTKSGGGSYAKPACSTTFCHSPGNKNSAFDAPKRTANWNDTVAFVCSDCHGGPIGLANVLTSYAHLAHTNSPSTVGYGITCDKCHAATAVSNTSVAGNESRHTDRIVSVKFDGTVNQNGDNPAYNGVTTDAGGSVHTPGTAVGTYSCSNVFCHSNGNIANGVSGVGFKTIAWNAAATECDDCHGDDATNMTHSTFPNTGQGLANANSHVKHVENSGNTCDQCHYATITSAVTTPSATLNTGGPHLNRQEDVVFSQTGSYVAGTKTCNNTYCHGTSAPRWGGAALGCDGCHEADFSSGANSLGVRHDVHYNTTTLTATSITSVTNTHTATSYVFGCANCHTVADHTMGAASGFQVANVGGAMISKVNYTKGASNSVDLKGYGFTTNGTCNNTYCHSSGKATPNYVSVTWNAAMTASCKICHRDASGAGGGVAEWTAGHNYHLIGNYSPNTNITCASCHIGTAASNTSIDTAARRAEHLDGGRDVYFNTFSNNGSGSWNGTNCTNTYCHSDGKASPTSVSVAWNAGSLSCTACHQGKTDATTLSVPHPKHVGPTAPNYNKDCTACHGSVVSSNTQIGAGNYSLHVNGSRNVDSGLGFSSPNCTTTTCHSTGNRASWGGVSGSAYNATTAWSSGALGCNSCHKAADTFANMNAVSAPDRRLSLPHYKHLATDTTWYGNTGRGTYKITCNNCHYGTTNDGTTITNTAWHTNGLNEVLIDLSWAADGVTPYYDTGTKTCSNVYCHTSQTKGGIIYNSTPADWDTGDAGSYDGCNDCHGFPPATGDHSGITNNCKQCHDHVNSADNGFENPGYEKHINHAREGGGESGGNAACGGCHSDLYERMHGGAANMIYKHFMNTADIGYPTDSQPAKNANTKKCLMCHVDHDLFRWDKVSFGNRAGNLRTSILVTPTSTDSTTVKNSDFNATTGGICLSCHYREQFKTVATNDGVQNVPALPVVNGGTITNAVNVFKNSSHNYSVFSGTFGDSTKFNATCIKCHNDTMDSKWNSGESREKSTILSGAGAQRNEPRFGMHVSSANSFLAPMGTAAKGEFVYAGVVNNYAAGTKSVTISNTIARDYSGYFAVITNSTGGAVRAMINNTDYSSGIINANWGSYTPTNGDYVEITKEVVSADDLCFNCHSRAGDGYKTAAGKDFYNTQSMDDKLEGIYSLFIGDSGQLRVATTKTGTTVQFCTNKAAVADKYANYAVVIGTTKKTISTHTAVADDATNVCDGLSYGYTQYTTLTLTEAVGKVIAVGSKADIMKPAYHQLDKLGRHSSDEMLYASAGAPASKTAAWNIGDSGTCSASASSTTCYDLGKNWGTTNDTMKDFSITFASGACYGRSVTVSTSVYNGVTFPAPSGCTPVVDDSYYIGNRHVSCSDCHNTHAAQRKPAGLGGTSQGITYDTSAFRWLKDSNVNSTTTSWGTDKFKGYLLILVSNSGGTNVGLRQVRQVSASLTNATNTAYIVNVPFNNAGWGTPTTWQYEVVRLDGSTGEGGKGVWGVKVGNMTTGGQDPATFSYQKVYDAGGDVGGKQYDQCFRCHSWYGMQKVYPSTPSGHANAKAWPATDTASEFNPKNKGHHAVIAVGKNQPIGTNGTGNPTIGTITSGWNPNWGLSASLTTTAVTAMGTNGTSGSYARLVTTVDIPTNTIPGWYANLAGQWYQVVQVNGLRNVHVALTNGNPWDPNSCYGGSAAPCSTSKATNATFPTGSMTVRLTPGLGSAFVPPYGPWAIIRCTECHGSTLADPLGPHASVNSWMIKDAVTALKFEDLSSTNVVTTVTPGDSTTLNYFCHNCHRRDVYGDPALALPAKETLSRTPHGTAIYAADSRTKDQASWLFWKQNCRHCHGGDHLGAIHGSNAANGKRLLNGAAWGGDQPAQKLNGTVAVGTCYANNLESEISYVQYSECSSHASPGTDFDTTATYDYESP